MLARRFRIPSAEIYHVVRHGHKIVCGGLDVKTAATPSESSRFAIVVPLRIDKRATARNRIRRLVSESIRALLPRIRGKKNVLITVTHKLPDTQNEVQTLVLDALNSAHMLA